MLVHNRVWNPLLNTPSTVTINVASGRADMRKAYRDKNLSGSFQFVAICNREKVYKRDEKTEDGDEVYLYYQMSNKWRFSNGPNFKAKTTTCWMYFESSERDIRKIAGTWMESDLNGGFTNRAEVAITTEEELKDSDSEDESILSDDQFCPNHLKITNSSCRIL